MFEITMIDVTLAVFSMLAIILALYFEDVKWKRWSPVAGLISQPFWIYESYASGSTGIFVISCIYLFIWVGGIKKYWVI